MARILVVEDEMHLADGLRFNLEADGHAVECVTEGEAALELLADSRANASSGDASNQSQASRYDIVILDVMLPGITGFEVAAELRKRGDYVPILMLTARGRAEDVLEGFAAGADDYLPKPFELKILLARVDGLLRRAAWARASAHQAPFASANVSAGGVPSSEHPTGGAPKSRISSSDADAGNGSDRETRNSKLETDQYTFANKTIDFRALELRVEPPAEKASSRKAKPGAGEARATRIQLTLMEAELLRYLVRHAGTPVSRKAILEDVWQLHEDTDTRAIDNFIARLRKYIEDEPAEPRHLLTVRGVGYKFMPDGE